MSWTGEDREDGEDELDGGRWGRNGGDGEDELDGGQGRPTLRVSQLLFL